MSHYAHNQDPVLTDPQWYDPCEMCGVTMTPEQQAQAKADVSNNQGYMAWLETHCYNCGRRYTEKEIADLREQEAQP